MYSSNLPPQVSITNF